MPCLGSLRCMLTYLGSSVLLISVNQVLVRMADNGEQDLETRVEDADVEELEDEEEMKKRHRQEARVSGVVGKRGSCRHGSHEAYCRCEARVARVYHGWVAVAGGQDPGHAQESAEAKES